MRRGRLTALAPSRTLLEGFDKGLRTVLVYYAAGGERPLNRDHRSVFCTHYRRRFSTAEEARKHCQSDR